MNIDSLRSYKIHLIGIDMALFDISATVLGSYLIAKYFRINPLIVITSSIPVSYLAHKSFGVQTPLTNKIDNMI